MLVVEKTVVRIIRISLVRDFGAQRIVEAAGVDGINGRKESGKDQENIVA